jgi:hypothetical protein
VGHINLPTFEQDWTEGRTIGAGLYQEIIQRYLLLRDNLPYRWLFGYLYSGKGKGKSTIILDRDDIVTSLSPAPHPRYPKVREQ